MIAPVVPASRVRQAGTAAVAEVVLATMDTGLGELGSGRRRGPGERG